MGGKAEEQGRRRVGRRKSRQVKGRQAEVQANRRIGRLEGRLAER